MEDPLKTLSTSHQSVTQCNYWVSSNDESSPAQTLEVSATESLKSDKFYLTSALSDGVLQQVEVTVTHQFSYKNVCTLSLSFFVTVFLFCFYFS